MRFHPFRPTPRTSARAECPFCAGLAAGNGDPLCNICRRAGRSGGSK